jgi:hypothetical protein
MKSEEMSGKQMLSGQLPETNTLPKNHTLSALRRGWLFFFGCRCGGMVLKKLGPLFLLCLFMACAGGPAPKDASPSDTTSAISPVQPSFFPSVPAGNGLVFIGVAGKRSNPKETLQAALEDAARRVTIFNEVTGEYAVENNIGSGAFDYTHNTYTSLYYNTEEAKRYVDALQFNANTDTLEIENTFFVRTTYPAALPVPVNYRPVYRGPDQKPDWVDNPPAKIEGYEVGVGYSARHALLADTYTNSCNNAIFAIIRNVNTVSRSSNVLYNTGGLFGYKTSSDNVTYSYGILTSFYVLDTWIDPHAKTVWTLAIAKKFD